MEPLPQLAYEPAGDGLATLILLDLNLPRKDGCETMGEIRTDPHLLPMPVVILTTSKSEQDIRRIYDAGVYSYVVKSATYKAMVETMQSVVGYWRDIVMLPSKAVQR